MPTSAPAPLILPYAGQVPALAGPLAAAGVGSALLGRVRLGLHARLGPHAVLRADGNSIVAGDDFHIGEASTVHIADAVLGTTIGHRVSVGANCVVHACTLADDCVVEDDAVVLDGAVVGAGSVIERGAVVFARAVLAPGQRYAGVPAVAVGAVDAAALAAAHAAVRAACGRQPPRLPAEAALQCEGPGYVAATVTGRGTLVLAGQSSVWFGCHVEGALGRVVVGARANVQDNSVLRSEHQPVQVGAGCTVGHNVLLHDCTVGASVLVGMGSRLAPGTVVGDEVLVAAGSLTTEGQQLRGGWMWGGRPARPIAPLDERKRAMLANGAAIYCQYAAEFAAAQAAAGLAVATPNG